MKPRIGVAPDRDGRDALPLFSTKEGGNRAQDRIQDADKERYRSDRNWDHCRDREDPSVASFPAEVSETRTVLLAPRAGTVRVAHPKDAA